MGFMKTTFVAAIMMLIALSSSSLPQTKGQKKGESDASVERTTSDLQAVSSTAVTGSGTPGRLARWTGSGTSFVLGDSSIAEDKYGKIGIGTTVPTSKLTVQGMIETTVGGYKFPDGTIQTSAAIGLSSIFHDSTLFGDGTSGSPLGLAVPLTLSGSSSGVILHVTNGGHGTGLQVQGGDLGIVGFGQMSDVLGGTGVTGIGGATINGSNGIAGTGVQATGGSALDRTGGLGMNAQGGDSTLASGGEGIQTSGGMGSGAGNSGGRGIAAFGGFGFDGATEGLAGFFFGDVEITGTISKGGGSFKIDHPLDPENKYLYHSFVESPDMMNIYNGNVTTDSNGEAIVTLPDYFEALNRDFRYQLTVIGQFAQAIVAREIAHNSFTIKTDYPGVRVSWQVTGIRHDAWADKHRIKVEVEKPERERGSYLHPDVFNQSEEMSVEWARNPEVMTRLKETRGKNKH
jgi:hypothetical protein